MKKDRKKPQRRTPEEWVEILVRGFFGALVGACIGGSWMLWLTPLASGLINWLIFAGAVVICVALAIRYGDDFFTSENLKWW